MIQAIGVRSFSPFPCSLFLLIERFRKRECFVPPPDIVTILRVGALDWIAQQDNELDTWKKLGHFLRCVGIEKVFGAGFSRQDFFPANLFPVALLCGGWKATAIPAHAFLEVLIEEMHLFPACRENGGMLNQVVVQRCSASFLRSDDEKIGQQSEWAGELSIGNLCLPRCFYQ